MATNSGASAFTAGELKLVASMLKYGDIQVRTCSQRSRSLVPHTDEDFQTDFDKVAAELGYKTGGVAKQRWGQIKKKKLGNTIASTDGAERSPNKTTQGTKRAATDADDDDDEATPVKTPAKRGRKSKSEKREDSAGGEIILAWSFQGMSRESVSDPLSR